MLNRTRLTRPRLDRSGQGLTEYIILLLLIAIASIVAVKTLGNEVKSKIQQARKELNEKATLEN